MRYLLLLFIAMPIIEIGVLIRVGGWLGLWPTLIIVIITAVLGTWMLRQQSSRRAITSTADFRGCFITGWWGAAANPWFRDRCYWVRVFVAMVKTLVSSPNRKTYQRWLNFHEWQFSSWSQLWLWVDLRFWGCIQHQTGPGCFCCQRCDRTAIRIIKRLAQKQAWKQTRRRNRGRF